MILRFDSGIVKTMPTYQRRSHLTAIVIVSIMTEAAPKTAWRCARIGLGKISELSAGLMVRWFRNAQRALHLFVGLAFLVLAGAGSLLSFSEWQRYRHDTTVGLTQFGMLSGFTVLLTILSLYSFLKARSVR